MRCRTSFPPFHFDKGATNSLTRLPRWVGGHPSDVRNLWPQPAGGKWSTREKDELESSVCRQVCQGESQASRQGVLKNTAGSAVSGQCCPPSIPTQKGYSFVIDILPEKCRKTFANAYRQLEGRYFC